DGDLSRLVRGTTSQGLILGRPLSEGEILAIVEEDTVGQVSEPAPDPVVIHEERHEVLGRLREPELLDGGLAEAARRHPATALPAILSLVRACYLGCLHDEEVAVRLERCLDALKGSALAFDGCEELIASIL